MSQVQRRKFLVAAGALPALAASAPLIAFGQARPVRIGFLAPRQRSVFLPSILKRLGELGYAAGKNLVLEYRSTDGVSARFLSLAQELIQVKCDLIFTIGTAGEVRALMETKPSVPLVLIAVQYDPVKAGIVPNFRRPGGNVTGMYFDLPALGAKFLQLMREMLPKAKRFLVLVDFFTKEALEAVRTAANQLRVEIIVEPFLEPPYDIESAFTRSRAAGAEAVVVLDSPSFFDQRRRIAEAVMKHRLPSVVNLHYLDESAFLISYGANFATAFSRLGDIAASILKGAMPGDIPVEQPTEFELVVNLRAGKTLGISIPQSMISRATRVIE
jgi:putative ABC transport system substrate-binding protein